jgi:hypothetical protein
MKMRNSAIFRRIPVGTIVLKEMATLFYCVKAYLHDSQKSMNYQCEAYYLYITITNLFEIKLQLGAILLTFFIFPPGEHATGPLKDRKYPCHITTVEGETLSVILILS